MIFRSIYFNHRYSRRIKLKKDWLILLSMICAFALYFGQYLKNVEKLKFYQSQGFAYNPDVVTLTFVACGEERIEESLVMLKSAIIFSTKIKRLNVIGFGSSENFRFLALKVDGLRRKAQKIGVELGYEIHQTWFPKIKWSWMFRPCSTQRLFIPNLLPHIDSLVYIDTDSLFLSDLANIWKIFQNFDEYQLAALAPEHELPGDGWYNGNRIARYNEMDLNSISRIPYFGPRGLNAGIMLMNLTRMRSINFHVQAKIIYRKYKRKIDLADQDILNIFFKFNSQLLKVISCSFNYRVQHCKCDYPDGKSCSCDDAESNGIQIFHANRFHFHNGHFELITNLYKNFQNFEIGQDSIENLYKNLLDNLRNVTKANKPYTCAQLPESIFSNVKKYLY